MEIINKKCKCNKTINDNTVIHECIYSGLGYILFLIGMSAKPSMVKFKCVNCGVIFGIDKNPETLKKYVGR
ncbi:MAG TPA: hypothetical protein PL041_02115 [Melioribacteraceae bacterium]|nr:hypothetical protein [Melioribacteraceae bacterium]